jgi:hypothetical protein
MRARKGLLDAPPADELLRHVVKYQGGLRIGRRISHMFVMDAPRCPNWCW